MMGTAYPGYRSVHSRWVPHVPEHWLLLRAKNFLREIDDRTTTGEETLLSMRQHRGLVPHNDVSNKRIDAVHLIGYKKAQPNELVLNRMQAGNAMFFRNRQSGLVSPDYAVFRLLRDDNPEYLGHLFRSWPIRGLFRSESKGLGTGTSGFLRLYSDRFAALEIPLPPRPEQDQIVAYLRAQDAHIARHIKTKRELIALLTEQKLRIIDHAVMRGLDASVKFKPSGVEWLGNVPEGWAVIPLKRLVKPRISDGPHESPIFVDDGVPFVSAEAVFNGRINLEKRRANISREDHERYCKKVRPQRNDIFIVKSGSTTGKCCIVDFNKEFSIWSPLALVRANQKANAQFLFFTLCSSYFQKQVQEKWSFGTQPNIGMGVLENLRVATPTISEQAEISKLISNECKPLDEAIAKAEDEIKLIREYRDRLIADVVTGQIDIRGWQPGPDDVVNDEDLAALGDDEECEESAEEDDDGAD